MQKKKQIHFLVSEEDLKKLNEKCKARNVNQSVLIRELIHNDTGNLYNKEAKKALDDINTAYLSIADKGLEGLDIEINKLEEGIIKLWHSLR